MALFMNVCKFIDCGLTFKSLGLLIEHIEDTHIDFDSQAVDRLEQQQPSSISLSYILRYNYIPTIDNARPLQTSNVSLPSYSSTNVKNPSTGSEIEEVEDCVSELEDSNDSWSMSEEYSSDFTHQYSNRSLSHMNHVNNEEIMEKPFACPVPGCKKRYKNINGIRYHSKNGHKSEANKAFKCFCGKVYKTQHGLKNHMITQHNNGTQIKTLLPKSYPKTEASEYDFEPAAHAPMKAYRPKVAAMEDHGYMKTDHLEIDCNVPLGILTPASSPIKVDPTAVPHTYNQIPRRF